MDKNGKCSRKDGVNINLKNVFTVTEDDCLASRWLLHRNIVETSAPTTNDLALPVAAIVCISVACYTILIIGGLFLRYAIRRHQLCTNCKCKCNPCGSEEPLECTCCVNVSQSCNCDPSLNKCLDKMCPNRKSVSCVDVMLCQCFAGPNNCCTNADDEEDICVCPDNQCCSNFNICCFEVSLRTAHSVREHHDMGMPHSARSLDRQQSSRAAHASSTIVEVINI